MQYGLVDGRCAQCQIMAEAGSNLSPEQIDAVRDAILHSHPEPKRRENGGYAPTWTRIVREEWTGAPWDPRLQEIIDRGPDGWRAGQGLCKGCHGTKTRLEQCACFACNTSKGASAANDQLRLVA